MRELNHGNVDILDCRDSNRPDARYLGSGKRLEEHEEYGYKARMDGAYIRITNGGLGDLGNYGP